MTRQRSDRQAFKARQACCAVSKQGRADVCPVQKLIPFSLLHEEVKTNDD